MGVNGLLKTLKNAKLTRDGNFADETDQWRGKTAVIDGYSWLHKAVYGCARRVAGLDKPFRDSPSIKSPEKFAMYVLHRLGLLVHYGIRPVVIFDGCRLDAKRATNAARREGRKAMMEEGRSVWRQANALYRKGGARNKAEARRLYDQCEKILQRCVSVTHEVVNHTIRMMKMKRKHGGPYEFIVAPYEADSQMAYQCMIGKADLVISEDSDCLTYLAAAGLWDPMPPLITKLDRHGSFVEVRLDDLLAKSKGRGARSFAGRMKEFVTGVGGSTACDGGSSSKISVQEDTTCSASGARGEASSSEKVEESKSSKTTSTSAGFGVGARGFIQMCVLAGCDYADSIKGIGVVKAQGLVINARGAPDDVRLRKIVQLQLSSSKSKYKYLDSTNEQWDEYATIARLAELTFLHHIVYDTELKQCLHLNPLNEGAIVACDGKDMLEKLKKKLGTVFSSEDASRIADGSLNPRVLGKIHAPDLEADSPDKKQLRPQIPLWASAGFTKGDSQSVHARQQSSSAKTGLSFHESKPMFNKIPDPPSKRDQPTSKLSSSLPANAFLAQLIESKRKGPEKAKNVSLVNFGPNNTRANSNEAEVILQSDLPQSPSAPARDQTGLGKTNSAKKPPSLLTVLERDIVVSVRDESGSPVEPTPARRRVSGVGKNAFAQYSMGAGGLYVVPSSNQVVDGKGQSNKSSKKKSAPSNNPFLIACRQSRTPGVPTTATTPGTAIAAVGTKVDVARQNKGHVVDLSAGESIKLTAAQRMKAREAPKKRSAMVLDGGAKGAGSQHKSKKLKKDMKRAVKKKKQSFAGKSSIFNFFKRSSAKSDEKNKEIINVGI